MAEDDEDFYEDDEPIEDIVAAWDASVEGGLTAPPTDALMQSDPGAALLKIRVPLLIPAAGNQPALGTTPRDEDDAVLHDLANA